MDRRPSASKIKTQIPLFFFKATSAHEKTSEAFAAIFVGFFSQLVGWDLKVGHVAVLIGFVGISPSFLFIFF